MASSIASSGAFSAPFPLKLRTFQALALNPILVFVDKSRTRCGDGQKPTRFGCFCCESVSHAMGKTTAECAEECWFDRKSNRP